MDPHVRGLLQAVELKAEQILFRGGCDNSKGKYPLSKKGHSMETLRGKLHLRPRTNIIAGGHSVGSRDLACVLWHTSSSSSAAPPARVGQQPQQLLQLHVLSSRWLPA